MLLTYSIIGILIFLLTGLSLLYLDFRKKSRTIHEKLEHTIVSIKMETNRNRISSHFFFIALNALSGPGTDSYTVSRKIKTLLMLLRKSVDNTEQTAIPAGDELEIVKGFIELQEHRIPEQFFVSYDIEPGTNMNQLIPAMILQIPVENAIKHGLLPLTGEKLLQIKFSNYSDGLQISVKDNGVGFRDSANRSRGAGTGLKILFQIIFLLNSQNTEKIEFSINDRCAAPNSGMGTRVEIKIPGNYSFDTNPAETKFPKGNKK